MGGGGGGGGDGGGGELLCWKDFFYFTVSWKKKRGKNWTADVKMVSSLLIT